MNRTQTPEQLFGYDVLDCGGTKIGSEFVKQRGDREQPVLARGGG